jgi:Mg2+ and Co2+ transporter CorA
LHYGYPLAVAAMFVIALFLYGYFKRIDWL